MRRKSGWLFCLFVVVLVMMPGIIQAQAEVWQPWDAKDVTTLGDDNTGSTFAISSDLTTSSGTAALQVMPSGTSEETKIAIPMSGADLTAWANYARVELDVYLPGDNTRNPTSFFMGMGDTTNGWEWVGGVFGVVQETNSEWYRIAYMPDDSMRHVDPAGSYIIYLSFFDDSKTPLTESFYLGSMYLDAPVVTEAESTSTGYDAEAQALLGMDDAALVDAVAHATFDFFWNEANPDNGLIKDRSTPDSPASIAAVGFGLAAIPVGIDRGWITQDEGYERVLTTLQTFANGGVQGEHGFFYHFVDMRTGERVWDSELSSIDTTLFIAGALTAGQYFKG
ncbi:MAG: hypothetical protein K8I60_02015, partial [Anaerolineae bacterium]|nr:hypothetical protein [Anaerolineae bacterium]